MTSDKLLLSPGKSASAKRVLSSGDPAAFFPAATGVGARILGLLAKGPNYPSQIARELGVYHQTVYYHMRSLEAAGLVRKEGTRMVRGGVAEFYSLASDGYAVEFAVKGERFEGPSLSARSKGLARFLEDFIRGGELDGWIVVGSPEVHGPSKTQGRDGHYAIQLGFALGQFVKLPERFPVKLDVDLKNENREKANLLLVGGPRTNIVSSEVNQRLPVRFSEESFWGAIIDEKGTRYLSETQGIVAKIANPWDEEKWCVVAAGLSGAGTKAAIMAMTNFADRTFDGYRGGAYAAVIQGVDLDGDGKVDNVEILHKTGGK
ncbi:MAG: helix-turn-helix domain-containing protein [Thaumarchaeota archaeon]|nr:helix-turn-helix domain-containing protein [Nitrososphaerota archaeon]